MKAAPLINHTVKGCLSRPNSTHWYYVVSADGEEKSATPGADQWAAALESMS